MDVGGDEKLGALVEAAPASGVVERSHACRRCGYELRGLAVKGVCPECGGLIARSLQGNLLAFANPGFLRTLAMGAVAVVAGIVVICAVPIGATVLRAAGGWTQSILEGPYRLVIQGAGALAMLGAGGLALVGWFTLTARDPGFIGGDPSIRARLITRGSTVVLAAIFGGVAVVFAMPMVVTVSPFFFSRVSVVMPWVLGVSLAAQVTASLAYVAHLAERVPDRKLRADALMIRRVVMVLLAMAGAGWVSSFLARQRGAVRSVLVQLDGLVMVVSVVYAVTMLGLLVTVLVRYSDIVDRVRRHALRLARLSEVMESLEDGEGALEGEGADGAGGAGGGERGIVEE